MGLRHKNWTEKRPLVFLDKTLTNAHDGKVCVWVDQDPVTGRTFGPHRGPTGKGMWLITIFPNQKPQLLLFSAQQSARSVPGQCQLKLDPHPCSNAYKFRMTCITMHKISTAGM